jgi:hypothetical protein
MNEVPQDIQLDREDVILMVIEANERLHGRAFLSGITRLEKLVYLLEQETDFEGVGRFFPFFAHNFGPFSKEVYEAVDFLVGCDLLEVREKAYGSAYASADEAGLAEAIADDEAGDVEVKEKEFKLTDQGRTVARKMREAVARRRPSDVDELDTIVLRYGAWPLRQIIRYVYRRYPKMTVNSIHPEADRLR